MYREVSFYVKPDLHFEVYRKLSQKFIGLENYRSVVTDPYFQTSFVNTIVYTLITVPAQMILGLLVAILINSVKKFKIGFRVAYYLPVITSWVIASLVFK